MPKIFDRLCIGYFAGVYLTDLEHNLSDIIIRKFPISKIEHILDEIS